VLGPHNNVLASAQVAATMSDFTISVFPPNQSIAAAGDPAIYTVQLTPHPVYSTNVSLSCTGTPTGSACSFAPTGTVTLLGPSPSGVTLNVTTTPRPINIGSLRATFGPLYAIWLGFPALAVVGVGLGSRRRNVAGGRKRRIVRAIAGMLMLYALLALILPLPACTGTSNRPPTGGTPAGNFTITVTAASGSDTKSTAIELTVP
jgi:trimeric autotransporter adhesin